MGLSRTVLVTGGAGFIGSKLAERLLAEGYTVKVFDNLSTGRRENLEEIKAKYENLELVIGDCTDINRLRESVGGIEIIFHCADYPNVQRSNIENIPGIKITQSVLHALRGSSVKTIVFLSSSTVYGEATIRPTPEEYGPLKPISLYGASKLAQEALISAFVQIHDLNAIMIRLANVVGGRNTHGVISDFINKLLKNPKELEILGDGRQLKSYIHVDDCVASVLATLNKREEQVEIVNVGSLDQISVSEIAQVVIDEMGLEGVQMKYSTESSPSKGGGWPGDVTNMLLDLSKLRSMGWKQTYNSKDSVKFATREILETMKLKAQNYR